MLKVGKRTFNCQIEFAFHLISGKWKTDLLWELTKQPDLRFNELQRRLPGITAKVLAKQLDELEDALLVRRSVFAEVPPRVEYRLTDAGDQLWHLCEPLIPWADGHAGLLNTNASQLRSKALANT